MLTEFNKKEFEAQNQIDVREDEEQSVKFEEIIEMLVFAGYYRARIAGLSNFDKIVGGMTWCIESCYFGVDIDLLFQENLTIGQKISLTEKIVVMLPKMNCPNRIEPHQIQGLDCIHILPVIQWLVKESLKTRKNMSEYVRLFAITQFDKKFFFNKNQFQKERLENGKVINNIKLVQETYQPCRYFKQTNKIKTDEFSVISNVLLEYGESLQIPQSVINKLQETKLNNSLHDKEITKEIIERKILEKKTVEELMRNLTKFDENKMSCISSSVVEKIVGIQAQEIAKVAEQYTNLFIFKYQKKLLPFVHVTSALEKQKIALNSKIQNMCKIKEEFNYKLIEITEQLKYIQEKKKSINRAYEKIKNINLYGNKGILQKLKELISIRDSLKDHQNKFRDQCRSDLISFNKLIEKLAIYNCREQIDNVSEYMEQKEIIQRLKLQLAKKIRAIASLIRQLDDIPGRSELTQYQRRFMELYNQVSVKHKETKQFYTLYNTLDDKKLYLSKELTLLNSIQDNYNEAMASSSGREQFLKQFEFIVDGVQKNKSKLETRYAEEKNRRDALSFQLISLMEQQRKYVAAVRQLTIECRKNETLLVQLRGP